VSYNGDYPRVFDVNTSTLALTPHPMSTSYQCHGSASDGYIYALGHADVAVNPFDNNEDVLVGRDQCFPSSGQVNGVVVSNVMMARLRDGQITALTDPNNEAFASHVSTRNINRPGWAYVDYEVENGKRSSAEEAGRGTTRNTRAVFRGVPRPGSDRDRPRADGSESWVTPIARGPRAGRGTRPSHEPGRGAPCGARLVLTCGDRS